ncbi:flagellar hook assembly protein FlgD [Pelomonas aquatica]|jgi:flagellar basal-body rod modification protein FlgD|uniref:Basal-body rod modification protein FlgD n=1 Tax=Pelomonas aquatica TaxID=431058 RepID=A0A9X4R4P6_9BURK|nr:flagellar hook capping FlgD N-terminal domain-containing protein [Pelomonas aquatica]MCY4756187.1 flagellar hook assembly protein FlgD [Pelomonas aquatica]MDG0863472.1 flagellar hook assembly protein FlgD [Pelomonas aquatica]
MDVTALNGSSSTGTSSTSTKNAADTQDRFLKLLVAQMNNQDPLNPMDNAQVTSQMAQIQQVTSLSTLNTSITGLGTQLGRMQALQSVSLVGREVAVPSNSLQVSNGVAEGSYDLGGAASAVKLEILGPAGNVIDTQQLGAQGSGRQAFSWKAGTMVAEGSAVRYRITATNGTAPVSSTTYAYDKVNAVYSENGTLRLNLDRLGSVDYTAVAAVN